MTLKFCISNIFLFKIRLLLGVGGVGKKWCEPRGGKEGARKTGRGRIENYPII